MRSYRLGGEKTSRFVSLPTGWSNNCGRVVANPETDLTADLAAICTIGGSNGTINREFSAGWHGAEFCVESRLKVIKLVWLRASTTPRVGH